MVIEINLKNKELKLTMGLFTSIVYIEGINIPKEVGREVTKYLKNFH
jgi:hypothetical protein